MVVVYNTILVKRMISLLKEFNTKENLTSIEFIDQKIRSKNAVSDSDKILYENCLVLMKHMLFFDTMVQNFWNYYDLKPYNKEIIMTLMYVIIFGLNEDNHKHVISMLAEMQYRFCFHVVDYFTDEENLIDTTQAGCQIFDNEHVLTYISHPIANKKRLIETVHRDLHAILINRTKVIPKRLTKPITPGCVKREKTIPPTPANSLADNVQFKCHKVPKSVLKGDLKLQENIQKTRKENRDKAIKLLEFSNKNAFNCSKYEKKPQPPENSPEMPIVKHTKIPRIKDVTIKSTTASLMREAATIVKDKETEIKKIEALTQSVFDPTILDALEVEIRKSKEQQHLQDIEKKHLQGLLTYEEAILAKKNLLTTNQEKMEEFKKERENILKEIELWKEKEQEKIRQLVEKTQNTEKAVKEAEERMHREKKYQARFIDFETKRMLKEAYDRKQEELARKVKLIQELRALEQVRSLQVKEFDPTEMPNFGLLCEMSIAELQERLCLMRSEMQEELEKRKQAIVDNRKKQQQLIQDVKQFIDSSRIPKLKPVPRSPLKLEQTPDLTALRERLEKARHERLKMQNSFVC